MKKRKKQENTRKPVSCKKKKLLLMISAGSLLVLAAGYTVFIAPLLNKDQWVYKEEVVERGTLKIGVTESGFLEYGITSVLYDLDLDMSENEEDEDDDEEVVQKHLKIEEVYVKTGQRISAGDMIYKFTEDSISDVRMLLKNAAAEAQSEYAEAQTEYNLSVLEAEADYEIRKLEEQYASSIHKKASQVIDNEISLLQLEISQRTANMALLQEKEAEAEDNYREALQNFSKAEKPSVEENSSESFMTLQREYLNLRTQYENAKSALSQAQQELEDNAAEIKSLQNKLTDVSEKSGISTLDADENYMEDVINGENALIDYEAKLESLRETLQEAEEEKDRIQDQLEAFETFVGENGCLYAENSGIVTDVVYEAGDRLQEAGVMLSYAMSEDMTISVDVTQEDIVDLEVGDKVDITFTAYGDVSYEGSIRSIDTTAVSGGSSTVSYTVVIAVLGDTSRLYGGMTADIVFVKEQKEDVLYVSKKAIMEENGKYYVYYKTAAGEMGRKEVETGIDNGVSIEILSGLEEGETIYLASRVSSENAVLNNGLSTDSDGLKDSSGNVPFSVPEGAVDMEGMPQGTFDGSGRPGGEAPQGTFDGSGRPGGEAPQGIFDGSGR